MRVEFKTTTGEVQFDEKAVNVESVDDPAPPTEDPGWILAGSAVTELRFSKQVILWFWRRELSEDRSDTAFNRTA